MKLVSGTQMQQLDRMAIEAGTPSLTLMENAGRAIVDAMHQQLPQLNQQKVCVVAGKGNNGGDGMVVARKLVQQGVACHVVCLAAKKNCSAETVHQWSKLEAAQIAVTALDEQSDLQKLTDNLNHADVVVDALLGVGLKGAASGLYERAIGCVNRAEAHCVCVDVPSGLDANTGRVDGACVRADLTVTLGLPKTGLLFYPAKANVGALKIVDIGYDAELVAQFESPLSMIDERFVLDALPDRAPDGHKGTFGSALLVAGSRGMAGAALLATQAALRGGAGLVHLAYPASIDNAIAPHLPEALKHPLPEGATWTEALGTLETMMAQGDVPPFEQAAPQQPALGALGQSAVEPIVQLSGRMNAVAIGPGLGQAPSTQHMVRQVAQTVNVPLVLDADGLNALVGHLDVLRARTAPTVLTPHLGEFSRLSERPINEIQRAPIEAAQQFAQQHNVVLVLKSATTVIATPDGKAFANSTGNAGLAKGGSGDALAGLLVSLCAQGIEPNQAACCAVWVHGKAADLLKAKRSTRSMLAHEVIDQFSDVFLMLET